MEETKATSFGTHIDVGIILCIWGGWWLVNAAYRFYSSTYTNKKFQASSSYPVLVCCKATSTWPIESYLKICLFIFEAAFETTKFFREIVPFSQMFEKTHVTVYACYGISGICEILGYHGVDIPKKLDYFFLAAGSIIGGVLLNNHNSGKLPVDASIHVLLSYICLLLGLVILTEMTKRDNYTVSFFKAYLMIYTATWGAHVGYIADTEMVLYATWSNDDVVKQIVARTSHFIWHGIVDLILCCILAMVVKQFVYSRRHELSKIYMSEDSEEETPLTKG